MDNKLSLDDVVSLPVDTLLKRIRSNPVDQSESEKALEESITAQKENNVPITVTSVESLPVTTTEENTKVDSDFNTEILKGKFPATTVFKKGDTFTFGDTTINIVGVIESAGRIKFKITGGPLMSDKVHSAPTYFLTGEEPNLPFVKGQKVTLPDGKVYEVRRLNPGNNNLVVWSLETGYKYIKYSKVTLCT